MNNCWIGTTHRKCYLVPPRQSYPYVVSSDSEVHHSLYQQQPNDGIKRKRGRPKKYAVKDGEDKLSAATVTSLYKKQKTLVVSPSKNRREGTSAIAASLVLSTRNEDGRVKHRMSTLPIQVE